MKKIVSLICLAFMLLFATPAMSQINLGVKTGLNLSSLDLSGNGLSGENRTGWFIGPTAEFTVPIVGIGADASFLFQTTKIGIDGKGDKSLNSFEIPINVRWSFGVGSIAGIFVNAGPQFGLNVGSKDKEGFRLKDNTTTFNVGAGVKLIKHLQLGVNYNFALSNTAVYVDSEGTSYDAKNNSWQLYVAYMF